MSGDGFVVHDPAWLEPAYWRALNELIHALFANKLWSLFFYVNIEKNKATNYHLGTLKAKLAKLRSELVNGPGGKSAGSKDAGRGFEGEDIDKIMHWEVENFGIIIIMSINLIVLSF